MDTAWVTDRLRARRSSIAALARRVGRDRTAVSRVVNGEQPMALWMAPHFAAELGVSEIEVFRRAGLDLPPAVAVPLISWVAASQFADVGESVDFATDYPRLHLDYHRTTVFALEVVGDSMDRIAPEGSVIVVDYTEKELQDRDLAVFSQGGETTFKRFRADPKGVWLEPESFNARHAPIVPRNEYEVEAVGRVVAILRLGRALLDEHTLEPVGD